MARRNFPRTGGTTFNPNYTPPTPKPQAESPWDIAPPFLSYDPALEAQRRAAKRGLEDTESDVKTNLHFAHTDLRQALHDIHVNASRKRQDISRQAARGQEKLGYQETDVKTKAGRAEQDFQAQLANIGRQFAQLRHRQGEAANAQGVLDKGTLEAGVAARRNNQRLAEAPIHTAQQRTAEDLYTALSRIGTARGELTADQERSLNRLIQDRNLERQKSRREYGRKAFGETRKEERARREAAISNVDLLAQEIYAARAEHPSVFRHWKQTHPEAMAKAEANAGGGAPSGGKKKRRH